MVSMTIPGEERLVRDAYIGRVRLAPRRFDYVFVSFGFYHRENGRTVRHDPIGEYLALTVSATVWSTRTQRGDCHTAGQCVDELLGVEPDGALREYEIRHLVKVWREWHLNDMRAGCVHQDPPPGMSMTERLKSVPPCPETGYRYGHAWLVEPLPAETERFVRAMAAKLTAQ
jgi:hypothetical protein